MIAVLSIYNKTMTIKEYLEHKQPISDVTIENTCLYKDIVTIKIQATDTSYAAIKVAHVGENLWAFGYEIQQYSTAPIICRDCTTHVITKGYIENLIYGMLQVLLLHLKKIKHTKILESSILDAAQDAIEYYKYDVPSIGKITL